MESGKSASLARSGPAGFAARLRIPRAVLLSAPLLFFLLLFFAAPMVNTVATSLRVKGGTDALTLAQYARFLTDPFYLSAVLTTVRIGLVTCLACILLGYPVALVMARGSSLQSQILMVAVIIPLMVNVVVRAYGWILILGRTGLLNTSLRSLGIIDLPVRVLYSEAAVVIASVHVFLPLLVLPLRASIERIDRRTEEAARTLGANALEVFLRITLPQSLPGLTAGVTLVFSLTASSFVIPALLGGDFVKMLGPLAQEQLLSVFDWEFGAAIAVTLTLVIAAFALLVGLVGSASVRQTGGR